MNVPVLLLDAAWRVDRVISSDRAVELLLAGRVTAASPELAATYHSPSTAVDVPSVIARIDGVVIRDDRAPACSHRRVRLRDGHRCQFVIGGEPCERRGDSVDHLTPRSLGGRSTWINLVAACRACNCRKANAPFEAMRRSHGWALKRQPFVPSRLAVISAGTRRMAGWEPFLADRTS